MVQAGRSVGARALSEVMHFAAPRTTGPAEAALKRLLFSQDGCGVATHLCVTVTRAASCIAPNVGRLEDSGGRLDSGLECL